MRRNILVFGSISGIIVGTLMALSLFWANQGHEIREGMVLGYASMILALSLIYVGVRNFRDKYNDGVISFGKALRLALGITLIASTIYVAVWLVEFYAFIPDFMDKYTAAHIQQVKSGELSQAALQKQVAEMESMRDTYDRNPLVVILYTYLEIVPVGIIISLLTALLLKRKDRPEIHHFSS
ncbi:MAG TPA: DUF4199 domain-containing protein [Puia sp.]|nr:DUF4199 domain-containing protein [Puia sp.]